MKKKIVLFTILFMVIFAGKSECFAMDYTTCIHSASGYKTIDDATAINGVKRTWLHTYCYSVTCSNGVYSKGSQTQIEGYSCQNQNNNPYHETRSDGCSRYSGTCSMTGKVYCTITEYVDCNRKADGSAYSSGGSSSNTTNRPVTIRPTTKKPTNKTTAKTNRTTTRNTPHITMPTIPVETNPTNPTEPQTTARTDNTNIKKIMVNNTDIKYNDSKDTYTLKLLYDVTDVSVTVELEDPTSTYEVTGNTGMPNEEHEIKIIVTSASGDKREVTLKVNRYTNLNNDCTLANIYSEEYPIEFSPNTYSYKLTLPKNVNSLDFEVVPSDEENATYSIEGNEKLKNRSVIKIDVRAEDGSTCQYTIKIRKSSTTWKYIVAIALLLGVLAVSSALLYKYLKKSKGRYKYE